MLRTMTKPENPGKSGEEHGKATAPGQQKPRADQELPEEQPEIDQSLPEDQPLPDQTLPGA